MNTEERINKIAETFEDPVLVLAQRALYNEWYVNIEGQAFVSTIGKSLDEALTQMERRRGISKEPLYTCDGAREFERVVQHLTMLFRVPLDELMSSDRHDPLPTIRRIIVGIMKFEVGLGDFHTSKLMGMGLSNIRSLSAAHLNNLEWDDRYRANFEAAVKATTKPNNNV